MSIWSRFKVCSAELNILFRRSIGPLSVFLFIYYLVTKLAVFPLGRLIWSRALTVLPDGYIGTSNIMEVFKHPIVLVVAIVLILLYAIISLFQIECAFVFVEYRYNERYIGFKDLIKDVINRTIKVAKPRNWMMLLFAILIIPFVNLFQVANDFGAIVVPEYIFTVIQQRTPLFIAFCVAFLLLLLYVLNGMYVFITFIFTDNDYKSAFKHSKALTHGFKNKTIKFLGIIVARIITAVLFTVLPIVGVNLINFIYKIILGRIEAFVPARSLVMNKFALPIIESFNAAMACAVIVALIIIWYETDSSNVGEAELELSDFPTSSFVRDITDKLTSKVFAGIIILGYIAYAVAVPVTTYAFDKNPNLSLKYASIRQIIAHKGYTAKAPENTLPALDLAIETGSTTIVEFDVQATKDGIPVVIHDANANALTGVDRDICDMTLSELKQLSVNPNDIAKYAGTQIPTLEEYLQHCNHRIMLLLEIKNYNKDPNLVQSIMDIVKKYGYDDGSLMIHSGSVDSLKKVKEINPDMQCGFIMTVAIGTFYDLSYADFFSIEASFIDRNVVNSIHSRYKQVFAWTVDDEYVVQDMYYAGVDGIICDDPDLVKSYINDYLGDVVEYANKKIKNIIMTLGSTNTLTDINTEFGD